MATRYWVGGAGTWNTSSTTNWSTSSGGASGASAPTSADNVIIDTSSGTGSITLTGAVCNDITVTATQAITLGIATSTLSIFGNLTFPSGGSFAVNTTSGNVITLAATATGKTVTTNGKSIGNLTVNGVGGGWTLGSALTTSTITLTNGTFDTSSASNYALTAVAINLGAGTKTLNLNASTVTLSDEGPFNFETNATNFTFNAGTSNITSTATTANVQPRSGGFTFYNVTFTNSPSGTFIFHNAGTYNNLTLPTSGGFYRITFGGTQTINGTLTLGTANTAVKRIFVSSNTLGTARTITLNGTLATLADVDFRDITAAGSVGTWTGTRLGNCLGNTNITFDAPKTVYWNLGGSVFYAANGWATSSGGTPAVNNFPLAQDTAVFDDVGTAVSVNTAGYWNIGTIDMSNRTIPFTFAFSGAAGTSHYGSLTLFSNLTLASGLSGLSFFGRGVTQTITSAGRTFPSNNTITIDNLTGTVQLGDAFNSLGSLIITSGTFNASNQNVTCTTFNTSTTNTRTLTMGSGTWTLSGTGTVWTTSTTTGLTFNKDTANIVLSDTSTTARTFAGGGLTYNNLTIGGSTGTSTLTITGTNTFNTLASTKTVAHTIVFPNVTTTVSNWTITGTSGNLVTLTRTGASGTFTLAKSGGGVISVNYLSISNSTASPSNTWYAGLNSTDGGDNTNWLFFAAPTGINSQLKKISGNINSNKLGDIVFNTTSISDWLPSDGTVVAQATYPELYSQIGLITDGFETWTARTSGTSSTINSLVYGNGLYVYGANDGGLRTSTNAITWTARTSDTTSTIFALIYGNGTYVYAGRGGVLATSTDAITWTSRTSGTSSSILSLTYGNSLYVYAGNGGVLATSTDAITWTTRTSGTTTTINALTYGNGTYVYGGNGGVLATSTDAITWTARTSGTASNINTLLYNNLYIYGADNGGLATSTDAITWTARTSGTASSIEELTYGNGLYAYAGAGGILATSTNAITWTSRTSGTTSSILSLTYGNSLYVYAGNGGVLATAVAYTYNIATDFILPAGSQSITKDVTTINYIKPR